MNKLTSLLCSNTTRCFVRNYAFKSDLKIKWVRPEKISCIRPEKSGDLQAAEVIPPSTTLLAFQQSEELKDAPEVVKQLFSVDYNRRVETKMIRRNNLLKEMQRHDLDFCSMEARLADMTARIRHQQEHMQLHPRNKRSKVILKELIDKRKRFLRYLRRWDYKRFEWALEKLDMIYKPYPTKFHWITRKDSLRKLTDQHCESIKEERLKAYRKELEDQQIAFLERKLQNLQMIRSEQMELKIPVTVSEDAIKEAKQQLKAVTEKNTESTTTASG